MAVFPKAKKATPKRLTGLTKKAKALGPVVPYLEVWNTRYGTSERIVYRRNGKFIDSVSLDSLRKGKSVTAQLEISYVESAPQGWYHWTSKGLLGWVPLGEVSTFGY